MTGYGHSSRSVGPITFIADVKSVNHRYLDMMIRLPREWQRAEDRLRKLISARVRRGRIDLFVAAERTGEQPKEAAVDWQAAQTYVETAKLMEQRFGLDRGPALSAFDLLQLPEVFSFRELPTSAMAEDDLAECVEEALQQLVSMRVTEGRYLAEDCRGKLAVATGVVDRIAALAPAVVEEQRAKLQGRLEQLLGGNMPVDQARLATEIAFFADRASVDEELTRLRSHFSQFEIALRSQEPIGRKLDFLLQEMNREVNTIGSKSNHAAISECVVEVKTELEKLREQIQNME